ncbi:hypothetical protein KY290_011936 [Solanum tuberosum]|uniref:C2H2-type domain-containing protein n=1 Tax=Solanum tuberosum TaxID=4113 RepID=A0ABQ7W228_SOLTU|nr:hypothetical protein KY289_012459 [Solanum tuberosum]KAH0710597.1 hypothetical protein KY284_012024 [Solanum tuberosum]KAH0736268.1 hypothetical protein KY285_011975 [Solanum tuberosum]KAH0774799.1 hypothetical protein KY290_011936 [Solanum tuberosum]
MGTLWINQISEKEVLGDHKDVMEFVDEDEIIPKDNKRRICRVCKKGFSSGKALGGHMRIHVQSSKKEKSKPRVENCNNDQLVSICKVCGKIFPSMKSLFGHMRSHPEREWRGILPPHLKSSDEIREKKTASATVPGWSVTAKRGRKTNAEDDEQLQDAVHHLMLLANGHDILEELEKTNSNSLTSKAENEEFVSELEIIDNRKRRKKTKLRHLNSVQDSPASVTAATPEKFKCNTCGKRFATHQALGGHKSSHNKLRIVIENSNDSNVAAISEEATASSSKLLADGGRIVDFDLNELPSDHEDEIAGNPDYFPFFSI